MRSCLSFLVVEKLREGHSVQEACRMGLERLLDLERPGYDITEAPGAAAMYPRLTAAVIAMDKDGNVRGAAFYIILYLHIGIALRIIYIILFYIKWYFIIRWVPRLRWTSTTFTAGIHSSLR